MVKRNGGLRRHLHTLFNVGAIGALTDGQLLERFAAGHGEARELAFATLVERHGPLVLRVCRAILGDEHQSEDAFQATFLALIRKAESLSARDSVSPWLHQAAYRAACHERAARRRRQAHERAAARRSEWLKPDDRWQGIEGLIHEEINRLPAPYRVVVVLCDLEGRTQAQAARHLGCAVGTVKSRLTRGRDKLRGRLIRRGIAPTAGVVTAFAAGVAKATVPAALMDVTLRYAVCGEATVGEVPAAVAALTEGVLISMFLTKFRLVAMATAFMAIVAVGVTVLAQQRDEPGDELARNSSLRPAGSGVTHWTYEIFASKDGKGSKKVAVLNVSDGRPLQVETPEEVILIKPKIERGADGSVEQVGQAAGTGKDPNSLTVDEQISALMKKVAALKSDARNQVFRTVEEVLSKLDPPHPEGQRWQDASDETKKMHLKALKYALHQLSTQGVLATQNPKAPESGQPKGTQPAQPPLSSPLQETATTSVPSAHRLDELERKLDLILKSLEKLDRRSSGN